MIEQNNEIGQNFATGKTITVFFKVILSILEFPCDLLLMIIKLRIFNQSILFYINALLKLILGLFIKFIVKAYKLIVSYLIKIIARELFNIILEEAQTPNSEIINKFKILLRLLRRREGNSNNFLLTQNAVMRQGRKDR